MNLKKLPAFLAATLLAGCANGLLSSDSPAPPDRDAVPMRRTEPVFPRAALLNCISGHVLLEFQVTSVGKVRDIAVVESKPPGVFDVAAAEAIAGWRFMPDIRNGKAVNQRTRQKIDFKTEC